MDDPPKVLFVDDEPPIADGYVAELADYDAESVYAGRAALERLDDSFDVVFLDRRMPGMSGEAVLDAIRERGYDCRVVMLTGVEPDSDVVEMGFDGYLVKPVQPADLRDAIDRLVEVAPDGFDEALFEALGDPITRRCCAALVDDSLSARELGELTGYSLPTIYRRLNALQQAGLIESRSTIDPDGDHYKTYTTVPTRVRIEITEDVQVAVEHPDEPRV